MSSQLTEEEWSQLASDWFDKEIKKNTSRKKRK